jgi:hypothetical protein
LGTISFASRYRETKTIIVEKFGCRKLGVCDGASNQILYIFAEVFVISALMESKT